MNLPYELLGKPKRTPGVIGIEMPFQNTAGMLHEEGKAMKVVPRKQSLFVLYWMERLFYFDSRQMEQQ
ncbi:hypothetical protein [Cytobacillus sp. AMY 15.2]|uniref:hypothetical protein n=1 Tax=Cytobacillus sp. AMY 15.2 TaxID=2939563 RepID=UPI00203EF186|nr:hypothetical protein [Cytobacillus sp. AMY 15.2]